MTNPERSGSTDMCAQDVVFPVVVWEAGNIQTDVAGAIVMWNTSYRAYLTARAEAHTAFFRYGFGANSTKLIPVHDVNLPWNEAEARVEVVVRSRRRVRFRCRSRSERAFGEASARASVSRCANNGTESFHWGDLNENSGMTTGS